MFVCMFLSRVLDENRRPLGYLDVAQLKTKWEAGQANPVRYSSVDRFLKYHDMNFV